MSVMLEGIQSEVAQVVEDVFATMLGLPISPYAEPALPTRDCLTAAVHFAGAWKGAVLLQCTMQQASEFTRRLVPGCEIHQAGEFLRDAMGELANMVGGNLKSLLLPGIALSMPSVVEGTNYAMHICGGNPGITIVFESESGIFWVTLVQQPEWSAGYRNGASKTRPLNY